MEGWGRKHENLWPGTSIVRLCENFDRVQDLEIEMMPGYALAQLQDTAGIAGDEELWSYCSDMGHLALQECLRRVRV